MDISPWSLAAVAVMVAALVVALSKKFIATGTLLIANIVVFLIDLVSPLVTASPTWQGPAVFDGSVVRADLAFYGPNLAHLHPLGFLQTFTSMFLHGGLLHIFGNSIFLWAFGMPFEERIGPRRFITIYILGGLAATLVQFSLLPGSEARGLGASGAIAAIMGAFAMKYPRLVVPLPVPMLFIMMMLPVPVVVGVGIFLVLQLVDIAVLGGNLSGSGVGYGAHLGGLAAGVILAVLLLRHVSGPMARGREGRVTVDLPKLEPFAQDPATKQVLLHMSANHDEPEVFQAWLDKFFRTATCPTCAHKVLPGTRGHIVCTQGHKFDVRVGQATTPPAATAPGPPQTP